MSLFVPDGGHPLPKSAAQVRPTSHKGKEDIPEKRPDEFDDEGGTGGITRRASREDPPEW